MNGANHADDGVEQAGPTSAASPPPAGWYENLSTNRYEWWNGLKWSDPTLLTNFERREILARAVVQWTSQGWRTELLTDNKAALSKESFRKWYWDSVLLILTAGLWLVVIVIKLARGGHYSDHVTLYVDEYGRVAEH
jgi:hypothetical protein